MTNTTTTRTNTIAIDAIVRSGDTQGRANMGNENVENLMDVITQGIPFHTPIKLARFGTVLFLVDGFHRVEAYERLGYQEIPACQCEITEVSELAGVKHMAVAANVKHGKGATEADYRILIEMMVEANPDRYMKNAFEVDLKAFCEDFDMPIRMVRRAYGDYKKAHEELSLSAQLKKKRDEAILEQHRKGLSNNAIAKMYGMNRQTVDNWVRDHAKNAESVNFATPTSTVLPLAATRDESTLISTDALAAEFYAEEEEGDDVAPFMIDDEWLEEDGASPVVVPEAPAAPAVPSENDEVLKAKADPSSLIKDWKQVVEKVAFMSVVIKEFPDHPDRIRSVVKTLTEAAEQQDKLQRIAKQAGISLS